MTYVRVLLFLRKKKPITAIDKNSVDDLFNDLEDFDDASTAFDSDEVIQQGYLSVEIALGTSTRGTVDGWNPAITTWDV